MLLHDGLVVWDTLAIVEYLAELHPGRVWPQPPGERARARSLAAEMHAGFVDLRRELPMDVRARKPGRTFSEGAAHDIARIARIWSDASGPFLFGGFGGVDAMYAPVATRVLTYGIPLPPTAQRWRNAIATNCWRWRRCANGPRRRRANSYWSDRGWSSISPVSR